MNTDLGRVTLIAKQGHQTSGCCEGASRRGWGWRSVAERVPRSPSVDAFVARSAAIIFHSWCIKKGGERESVVASNASSISAGASFPEGVRTIPDHPAPPSLSTSSTIHGRRIARRLRSAFAPALSIVCTNRAIFPQPPLRFLSPANCEGWKRVITSADARTTFH